MKILAAIPLLLLLCGTAAVAQEENRQLQQFRAMIARPLSFDVQPDRVQAHRKVTVSGEEPQVSIDLYLPKAPNSGPLPVAILLHGGLPDYAPIRPTDWRIYQDWGTALAQSGVAAIVFNHRLGYPKFRVDEAVGQVSRVIDWVRSSASTRGLDPAQVTVVTLSAGALLVPELARKYDASGIRRYALFYPLLGIDTDEHNDAAVVAKVDFVAGIDALKKHGTPVLLFRAGADEIPKLLTKLDAAIPAALRADLDLELINLPGQPHAFDMINDIPQIRRTVARTIEFAKGH